MPGSQRSESREPAVLRTAPISPGTPARTPNLESHASPSRPAGGLTFLPYIHNSARDGTRHRVSSSQLCAEWLHTLAQTDLAAPVLGLLMTEGHLCFCFVDFLLCFLPPPLPHPHGFFLKTRLFCDEQWSSGFVLNQFDFLQKKKKFLLLFRYICFWWYSGRAVGIVYPDNKMGCSG